VGRNKSFVGQTLVTRRRRRRFILTQTQVVFWLTSWSCTKF